MEGERVQVVEPTGSEHISLEIIEVIQTADAIHMRFRVMK